MRKDALYHKGSTIEEMGRFVQTGTYKSSHIWFSIQKLQNLQI